MTTTEPQVASQDPHTTVCLVDISAIGHAIWHTSETVSNRDQISASIVARVHSVTRGFRCVAICCDAGRSFRHEIDPHYKAQRVERDAGLHFQLDKAIDRLSRDGYVVWKSPGFEADDLIASASVLATGADLDVMIVSSDKDLLQLVGPRVVAKSLRDGSIIDAAAVEAKFGVRPDQMRDFLTLTGDTSDNVPGAKRIGKVTAAKLLSQFGTLDALYNTLDDTRMGSASGDDASALGITPSIVKSLDDFRVQMPVTRSLITLRSDVPLFFEALMAGRTECANDSPVSVELEDMPDQMELNDDLAGAAVEQSTTNSPGAVAPLQTATAPPTPAVGPEPAKETTPTAPVPPNGPTEAPGVPPAPSTALAKADAGLVVEGEVVWERQLEPRNMRETERMATILDKSGLFLEAYSNAPAVMTAILAGRELGLATMASLRGIHMIEGKAALSASLMVALLLRSGVMEYFEMESGDDKQCTFVAKRHGARKEQRLTHTIEMATRAGLVKPNSNWIKVPEDMLVARASSRLARLVAPDILFGIYTPEELIEARETK